MKITSTLNPYWTVKRFACFLIGALFCTTTSAQVIPDLQGLYKKHKAFQYSQKDSAIHYLQRMHEVTQQDPDQLLNTYNIGTWFYANRQVNLDSAMVYSNRAVELVSQCSDSVLIAGAYTKKGFVHSKRRDYKKAIEWLEKSIELKQQLPDEKYIAFSYNLLGNVYRKLDIFDRAEEYYKLAEVAAKDPNAISRTYKNIGKLYLRDNQPELAADYLFKAIDTLKSNPKMEKVVIDCKINLAEAYFLLERFEDANRLLRTCEEFFHEHGIRDNLLRIHRVMAEVYYKMGEFDLAEKYCLKSYARSEEVKLDFSKIESTKLLVKIYDAKKEYKKAFSWQKEFQQLSDSLSYAEIRVELLNKNLVEEIQAKEAHITILSQEKTIHKLMALSIAFGSTLLLLLIFWLHKKQVKRLNMKILEDKLRQASMDQELEGHKLQQQRLEKALATYERILEDQSNYSGSKGDVKNIIERLYDYRLLTDNDWSEFKLLFSKVHPFFLDQLHKNEIKLSNTDLKIAALMRLNLENVEIGEMLAISPESIRKAKYRLRQKLKFSSNKELHAFVYSL